MTSTTTSGDVLNVAGVRFSTIIKTDKPEINSMADIITYLKQTNIGHAAYPAGGDLLDAYLWSLSFGTLDDRIPGRGNWKPTISEWKEHLIHGQT